jgi:hypothetical protein
MGRRRGWVRYGREAYDSRGSCRDCTADKNNQGSDNVRVWRLGASDLVYSNITRGDEWCVIAVFVRVGYRLRCWTQVSRHFISTELEPVTRLDTKDSFSSCLVQWDMADGARAATRTPEWTSDERFYGRLVTDNVHLFDSGDFSKRVCTVPSVGRTSQNVCAQCQMWRALLKTCVHYCATCDVRGCTMM